MIEYYDLDPLIQILNLTFARKILFARKRVKVSRLVIRVKKKTLEILKRRKGKRGRIKFDGRGNEEEKCAIIKQILSFRGKLREATNRHKFQIIARPSCSYFWHVSENNELRSWLIAYIYRASREQRQPCQQSASISSVLRPRNLRV